MRKRPSASRGERPQRKPNLQHLFWRGRGWGGMPHSLQDQSSRNPCPLQWKLRVLIPGQHQGIAKQQHLVCTLLASRTGEGNGNPLQCSCLENPRDAGAWWAAIYGVAQSRTRLKRLSSSSFQNSEK